jgi:hypothetical protein
MSPHPSLLMDDRGSSWKSRGHAYHSSINDSQGVHQSRPCSFGTPEPTVSGTCRRLRAWAKANEIRVVYCAPKVRKHEIAEEQLPPAKVKPGLFLILVSKAPALGVGGAADGDRETRQLVPKLLGLT